MYKPPSLLESQHLVGQSRKHLYLIYEDRECHWWAKLFKKGYKHVYAVSFNGLFWIKMDFLLGYTDIDVLCYDNRDTIHDVMKGHDVIIQHVDVWRKSRYRVLTIFAPYTCVEAMKALLGIRAFWVFTPYQLFNKVKKNGIIIRRRPTRPVTITN